MRWQGPAAPLVQIAICQTHLGAPALHTNATSAIQHAFAVQRQISIVHVLNATIMAAITFLVHPTSLVLHAHPTNFPWELPSPAPLVMLVA